VNTRRARTGYFERVPGAPPPLRHDLRRRVRFNETDPMGIVWYGRYAVYFEEGAAELGRRCGLSYRDFMDAGLRAPVASLHVDYLQPLVLDEEIVIRCSLVWCEGARLNTEYELIKAGGSIAARGHTIQVFTSAATGDVCLVSPPLLERCRSRWRAGEFKELLP
jgi:acyl-CoA thioester hydrolase